MDWGIVYQLTFFLALGLLAIVITIFVFAVSQIGRVTAASSKEQQDILSQQKKAKAKRIESIEKQIAKAKKTGNLDVSKLSSELKNLTEESMEYESQLKHIQERIMLISRKGAVVCPGFFFLATLVLTATASGLADGQNLVALWLWIISIGTLAFGIFRVFRTLGAIEEVTITSEEAVEKLPEAVKIALRELEEERKPELQLSFKDTQPPFHVKAESEILIEFIITLIRGDIARETEIYFVAPPGFKFPDSPKRLPPLGKEYANYVSTAIELADITKGIYRLGKVKLKVPSQPEHYTVSYCSVCEGFYSKYEEFEVVVE